MEQAADSISEADVMDRMIHGYVTCLACALFDLALTGWPPRLAVPISSGVSFLTTPSCRPFGRPISATAAATTAKAPTARASRRASGDRL